MALRDAAATAGLVCLLLTSTGCDTGNSFSASSETSAWSHAAGETHGRDERACSRRQQQMVLRLDVAVQRLRLAVRSRSDVASTGALADLGRQVARYDARTRELCADAPLHALHRAVDAAAEEPLEGRSVRSVVDAYEAWGLVVVPARHAHIVVKPDPCSLLRRHVTVSHRVRYEPDGAGKQGWVDLRVHNDWLLEVRVHHRGAIAAQGVRPDGGTAVYVWGGSPADTAGGEPGSAERRALSLLPAGAGSGTSHGGRVRLTPDGSLQVVKVDASAYTVAGLPSCPVTSVPER